MVRLTDLSKRLLGLAETIHRWAGILAKLDAGRREKVARYADQIAETLARAADALAALDQKPQDRAARRRAAREIGRITGYVETIVAVLQHHLDGRKLAGVKRRLEQLGFDETTEWTVSARSGSRIERLVAAEGYFRALADSLRA